MVNFKKSTKIILAMVILVILCILPVFSVGQQEKAGEAKEVTLTIFARAYTWNQDAPWEVGKNEIQKRHPDIKFTFNEEGFGWSDLRSKFLTTTAGGNPPDVVQVDIIWLGEYVEGGLLTDVTAKAQGWSEWPDVVANFREATKWKGKIYGTWLNTDVRIMAYNKKLFRNAGLDPNKPPTDWNELAAYAKKISNPPAYYGFGFPAMKQEATSMRLFAFLYSAGGQILTNDLKKAAFNSDAGVKSLQFLVDMVKSGATPKSIVSGNYGDIDNGVFQDKFAMSFMTKTLGLAKKLIKDITPEKFKEQFGVAPIPKAPGGKPATMSGGYLLSVPKGSKNTDLAWELITIAAGAESQFQYTTARGYVPTFSSLARRADDYYKTDPYFNIILSQVPNAHFRPSIPQYTEISAAIQDAVQAAVLGQADAKTALDTAAKKVNQLLAQ